MAEIEDVLAALRAVAAEHSDGDDSTVDSEAGEDDQAQGADDFRQQKPLSAEMLLAKVEAQAEIALEERYHDDRLKRSKSGAKDRQLRQSCKQLWQLKDKTAELEAELTIKQDTEAELKRLAASHMALKKSKMDGKATGSSRSA